jgi:hypothetical protein
MCIVGMLLQILSPKADTIGRPAPAELPARETHKCRMRVIGLKSSDEHRGATWAELLEAARTSEDVLGVARDYLATWEPLERAAMPAPCKLPSEFATPEELVDFAFNVVQYHCGPGAGNELVGRAARFFSVAARRVAVLMDNRNQVAAGNEDSAA